MAVDVALLPPPPKPSLPSAADINSITIIIPTGLVGLGFGLSFLKSFFGAPCSAIFYLLLFTFYLFTHVHF